MPSSPKIPKEVILENALTVLRRDGYESVNIKSVAKEIGCSTQPISWHFGNMDGLRRELSEYARTVAVKTITAVSTYGIEGFLELGVNYIKLAIEDKNLFHYIFMNGCGNYVADNLSAFSLSGDNALITQSISDALGISKEQAARSIEDMSVYANGLATYIATGVLSITIDEAKERLYTVGKALFTNK
ncbi:MAG: TetR/AcrR family transcriptional regulator [Ruminococcus sp.]|nr:TetR/AcrR family transcriptional regulator [Ruminococcus sp.]